MAWMGISKSFGIEETEGTDRDILVCAGVGISPRSALEMAGVSQVSAKRLSALTASSILLSVNRKCCQLTPLQRLAQSQGLLMQRLGIRSVGGVRQDTSLLLVHKVSPCTCAKLGRWLQADGDLRAQRLGTRLQAHCCPGRRRDEMVKVVMVGKMHVALLLMICQKC